MARIKPEDMNTLISASAAKTVSSSALQELEEMSVAACINSAANTGETTAQYAHPISNTLKTKLKGQGYTLIQPAPIANPGDVWIISWKNAD